jgi:predicted DNA-binding protein (MmcQ/YjbR family)
VKQEAFDALCLSLPAATYVNQWGGSHVYKVGGKVFAIAPGWSARGHGAGPSGGAGKGEPAYIFKVSDMAFELLIEHGLAHPAPYLGRAKWVELNSTDALSDADLEAYIRQAHGLIAARLTRAVRKALALV